MADNTHTCSQCGQSFATREQLQQHIFQQHLGGNKPRQQTPDRDSSR
jgi:Zinc finger, C2H2 type